MLNPIAEFSWISFFQVNEVLTYIFFSLFVCAGVVLEEEIKVKEELNNHKVLMEMFVTVLARITITCSDSILKYTPLMSPCSACG